jgi:hypothetical protein
MENVILGTLSILMCSYVVIGFSLSIYRKRKEIAIGGAVALAVGAIAWGIFWMFTTPLTISLPTTLGGWFLAFLALSYFSPRRS